VAIENIFKRFFSGLEKVGDFVNSKKEKAKSSIGQMTLFEPQAVYNAKSSRTENFSFFRMKDL